MMPIRTHTRGSGVDERQRLEIISDDKGKFTPDERKRWQENEKQHSLAGWENPIQKMHDRMKQSLAESDLPTEAGIYTFTKEIAPDENFPSPRISEERVDLYPYVLALGYDESTREALSAWGVEQIDQYRRNRETNPDLAFAAMFEIGRTWERLRLTELANMGLARKLQVNETADLRHGVNRTSKAQNRARRVQRLVDEGWKVDAAVTQIATEDRVSARTVYRAMEQPKKR